MQALLLKPTLFLAVCGLFSLFNIADSDASFYSRGERAAKPDLHSSSRRTFLKQLGAALTLAPTIHLHTPEKPWITKKTSRLFHEILSDTRKGLKQMEDPALGLLVDRIEFKNGSRLKDGMRAFLMTNIALDLLLSVPESGSLNPKEAEVLNKKLSSLEKLPKLKLPDGHELYFTWYEFKNRREGIPDVVSNGVSSIDNLHLALALWTLANRLAPHPLASRAQAIFEKMDFSVFFDQTSPFAVNLITQNKDGSLEKHGRYDYLGAEVRSIYAITYALNLCRSLDSKTFRKQIYAASQKGGLEVADIDGQRLLRTWDGGTFQLLLPELLLSESQYSKKFQTFFENYSKHIKRHAPRDDQLPEAFSASQFGSHRVDPRFLAFHEYSESGHPEMTATKNDGPHSPDRGKGWNIVLTPHAAVLSLMAEPEPLSTNIAALKEFSGVNTPIYQKDFGFMDGVHLRGPLQGMVVPVQLSLDQGMIALSLRRILSYDRQSPSARTLRENPATAARLQEFYSWMDTRLEQL